VESAIGIRRDSRRLFRKRAPPNPGVPIIDLPTKVTAETLLGVVHYVLYENLGPGNGLLIRIENSPAHGEVFDQFEA
jgi:hypothetical protein